MALGGTYNTGLVGVTNASKAVTGVGVLWSDVVEGDWLQVGVAIGVIDSVSGTFDGITLKDGWAGISDSVITVTIASPAVVSLTAHGKSAGDPVSFFTTISLPTGLIASTTYYVIAAGLTSGAFEVAATIGGAAINTSGSQSGVHTLAQPYRVLQYSPLRFAPAITQQKVRQFINLIETASLFGVPFAWDTGTSDADPGAGNIRANNASLASATLLYISKTSRAGANVAAFLAALDDSTSSTSKGILILGTQPDGTQAMFTVGAVTDATNYIKLAISGPSGVTSFLSGALINFQFTRTGDGSSPLGAANIWTGVNKIKIPSGDADPSLTHNGPATLEFDGDSHATALVWNIATTSPYPIWMQSRNWSSDQTSNLLINPMGGGVAISTTISGMLAGLNSGLQIGDNWSNSTTYAPAGGPNANAKLTLFNDAALSGLVSFVRTSTITGAGQSISSYAYADNSSARGAWPIYTEAHKITAADYAGNEFSAVNRDSTLRPINSYNSGGGGSGGLQIESGNAAPVSDYTLYPASHALLFSAANNGSGQTHNDGFLAGIIFRSGSLSAQSYNPPMAISLAANTDEHAIYFWADATTAAWKVYSDATAGANTLIFSNSVAAFSSDLTFTGTAWTQTTPTPTASTGSFTTVSSIVRQKILGKVCSVTVQVTVTTLGTASGQIYVGLPTSASHATATAAVDNSSGSTVMMCQVSGSTMSIIPVAGIAAHVYLANATYEIA